jgi:flagellar hook-associated protein 1 FlgK
MHEGMDLNGNLGQDLFSYTEPQIFNATSNTGSGQVTGQITDIGALTANDYNLIYNGTNWTITSDTGTTATVTSHLMLCRPIQG